MEKDIIPPGDSAALEVIFSTRTYQGTIVRRPAIYSNADNYDSYATVTISSEIVVHPDSTSPIVISPYKFQLIQVGDVTVDSLVFQITNVTDFDLNLNPVDPAVEYLELDLPRSVAAHGTYSGLARVRADRLDQSFHKSITLELDDFYISRFTIPVVRTLIFAN